MFEHFSFDTLPRSPRVVDDDDISPLEKYASSSPLLRSTQPVKSTAPWPSTAPTLDDQEARPPNDDISASYLQLASAPLDIPDENFLAVDPKYGDGLKSESTSSTSASRPATSRTCRRLERQLHTQLLCTTAQLNALGALVDEIVASHVQPPITQPSPTPTPTPASAPAEPPTAPHPPSDAANGPLEPEIDEGFCDAAEDPDEFNVPLMLMTVRRAWCPSGIRKNAATGQPPLVFYRPRLRKKIMKRKRADITT